MTETNMFHLLEHGEAIAGMLITLVCVAGLLVSEIRARRVRREKEAKTALLRAAIVNAHIGVTITCAGGPISKVNPAFEEMLGYSESEIIELGWEALSHPEDHAVAGDAVNGLLESPESDEQTVQFFCRYRRKDGSYIPGYVNVTHVPGAGAGGHDILLAQIQDVNEFRKAWKNISERRREEIDHTVEVASA